MRGLAGIPAEDAKPGRETAIQGGYASGPTKDRLPGLGMRMRSVWEAAQPPHAEAAKQRHGRPGRGPR